MLSRALVFEFYSYVIPGWIALQFEDEKATFKQIMDVVLKIIFIDLTSRYFVYGKILSYADIDYDNLTFDWLNFVMLSIAYTLLQDIAFHYIHVKIHTQPFYSLIHEMHHRSKITGCSSLMGKSMTVLDFVIFASFTNVLKILVFGSNVKYMVAVNVADYLGTLYSHSGIVPNSWKIHHYDHHKHVKCNYGMTPFSDWLFGTLWVDKI